MKTVEINRTIHALKAELFCIQLVFLVSYFMWPDPIWKYVPVLLSQPIYFYRSTVCWFWVTLARMVGPNVPFKMQRMQGSFNPQMPMILSDTQHSILMFSRNLYLHYLRRQLTFREHCTCICKTHPEVLYKQAKVALNSCMFICQWMTCLKHAGTSSMLFSVVCACIIILHAIWYIISCWVLCYSSNMKSIPKIPVWVCVFWTKNLWTGNDPF